MRVHGKSDHPASRPEPGLRLSVLVEGRNNIRHRKPYVVGKDNDLVTKEKVLAFGNKKSVPPVIVSV